MPKNTDVRMTTTVVVILTSAFFGIYLFALEAVLLQVYQWLLRKLGAA